MLYHLFGLLSDSIPGARLGQYIAFRAAFAAILAFGVSAWWGKDFIATLRERKIAGYESTGSANVDATRELKAHVPTMGGVILLIGVGISALLFARLDVAYVWILLLAFLAFGALGAADDWKKLTGTSRRGLRERHKIGAQLAIALIALTSIYVLGNYEDGTPWLRGPSVKANPYQPKWVSRHEVERGESWSSMAAKYLGDARRADELATLNGIAHQKLTPAVLTAKAGEAEGLALHTPTLLPPLGREIRMKAAWPSPRDHHRADIQVPFFKKFCFDLGLLFIPLGILVIVGASNAVNLTDGLDGLAIGSTLTTAGCFAVIAYLVGRIDFSQSLYLFYIPEAGELSILCAALVGGSLGFLWFNGFPAEVFMGDTGSLSIGGFFGVLAVMLRHEFTLLIAGGLFVAEALSVIIQRRHFKRTKRAAISRGDPNPTGKRVFLCAPIHHHFEHLGWHENKVTIRFWIISLICAIAALASLKVR